VSLTGKPYESLAAAKAAGAATLNYGLFFNHLVNFLIVAFAIFVLIRQVNRLKREQPATAPATKDCPFCLSAVSIKATRCAHCTSPLSS
jgi:large conductance mechanosensitive channel